MNIDVNVLLFSLNMMLLSLAHVIRKKFGRVTSPIESCSVMNGIVRRTRYTHSSVACSANAIHLHLPSKRYGAATAVTAVSSEVIVACCYSTIHCSSTCATCSSMFTGEVTYNRQFFFVPHQIERSVLTERTVRTVRTVFKVRSLLFSQPNIEVPCIDVSASHNM